MKRITYKPQLMEHRDYEFDEQGRMVLTREYHLRRGVCCGNSCIHCPYDRVKGSTRLTSSDNKI